MKCSRDGCNATYRVMMNIPGVDEPVAYCAPHAIEAVAEHRRKVSDENKAPVIDIFTRKRIGANWSNRYANESKRMSKEKALQQAQQEAIANKTDSNDSSNDDVSSPDVY